MLGRIADERLKELSGLAASRRFPGWMWAHNDSGSNARLFLLDSVGRVRAVVKLLNAQAVDWEDIAVAGGARDSSVTVADCGDNKRERSAIALYRFREADLPLPLSLMQAAPEAALEVNVLASSLRLRYPEAEGAQDAEALCASADGSLLLVTKSTKPSRFYLARWPEGTTGGEQVLQLVAEKQFGSTVPGHRHVREQLVTGADVSPEGSRLALMTYAALYIWKLPPGAWDKLDWKSVLQSEPRVTTLPELDQMPQYEGVAWIGPSEVTVSSEGENAPLWSIPAAP